MTSTNQEPGDLERKADELVRQIQEVENEVKRQELAKLDSQKPGYLERKADELAGQIQEIEEAQSKSFVDPHNLEATLKEVNSYRFMPKGTYHVDFDITIYERGTLEVAPGTKIYFGPEAGIISCGILKAIGKKSEKERILFTASKDKWRNIAIAGNLASESVLEYCTISNGTGREEISESEYFEGLSSFSSKGGGLLIVRSSPLIRYCEIKNNQAEDGGGLCFGYSSSMLECNTITGNKAEFGGGLSFYESNSTLKDNIITNNQAEYYGGGLQIMFSNPSLVKNMVTGNQSYQGGGLYISVSSPVLKGNTITNNQANLNGGLCLHESSPTLKGNKIKNNKPNNIEK